jgi:predicted CoA-binding protein
MTRAAEETSMNEPAVIEEMLGGSASAPRSIAVVGLSDNPGRPSHYVSLYMQEHGYTVYPINPSVDTVLGVKSYPSLSHLVAAGIRPDVVNVFRVPSFIPSIVDEMLELGLKDLWVQQGIVHREAAAKAEEGGIRVVMDRCIMVEQKRLVG